MKNKSSALPPHFAAASKKPKRIQRPGKIKRLCAQAGFSITKLSKVAEVSLSTLSRTFDHAPERMPHAAAIRIRKCFGFTAEEWEIYTGYNWELSLEKAAALITDYRFASAKRYKEKHEKD